MTRPDQRDRCALDGDAFLPFQRIVIGSGRAFVNISGTVLGTAQVKQTLGERGFPGVHVGNDSQVTKRVEHAISRSIVAYSENNPGRHADRQRVQANCGRVS
jgi:hypothetical protein